MSTMDMTYSDFKTVADTNPASLANVPFFALKIETKKGMFGFGKSTEQLVPTPVGQFVNIDTTTDPANPKVCFTEGSVTVPESVATSDVKIFRKGEPVPVAGTSSISITNPMRTGSPNVTVTPTISTTRAPRGTTTTTPTISTTPAPTGTTPAPTISTTPAPTTTATTTAPTTISTTPPILPTKELIGSRKPKLTTRQFLGSLTRGGRKTKRRNNKKKSTRRGKH